MSQAYSPEAIVQHHVQAMKQGNLDEVLEDYTDASVVVTQTHTYRGLEELRGFFSYAIELVPDGFWDAFTITKLEVCGDVVYDMWEAQPWIPCGTDTFVMENGKVLVQTGATCVPAEEALSGLDDEDG